MRLWSNCGSGGNFGSGEAWRENSLSRAVDKKQKHLSEQLTTHGFTTGNLL